MAAELILLSRVAYRGQEITGPRLRSLLALLADDLRTGCSTSRLVAGLWPEEQPENPTKALQVLVSRVRAQLGPEVIASTPTGYRLALAAGQVDAAAVQLEAAASAAGSRAGDYSAALAHAESGLALWDGGGGAEAASDDPLATLRAERAPVHRALVRARALALSRLGRRAEAVEPLTELARERPRDEEVLLELLRCEAATAGPAAALARYDAYRRALRDRLGTDPGTDLRALHQQLLQAETPAVRRGVAHEPNPLLGRTDDLAAVTALLHTSRVTSIVGPGGLGKTRLAHVVSRQAEQRVVHFVPLAGVTADDDVAGEVASALGGGSGGPPFGSAGAAPDAAARIVAALGSGHVLLVLDNCEQVVRGVADLVQALVSTVRDLHVLTTSRAPLGLSSESVYVLPELSPATSVELFEQRARAARPGVELPPDVVGELCRHLDGLPLAVELAAARVRVMSVAEIARRLDDRFALLRGGARDTPQRHRTLQAVVDWSWNLLDPPAQDALRALSVFPAGFSAAAAEHILDHGGALDVLEHLVDQSLLKVTDGPAGVRFRMLETVREFGAARCEVAGVSDRVAVAFLTWARDFALARFDGPLGADPYPVADAIQAEQDNLLHAMRLSLARDDGATVVATGAALASMWMVKSQYGRLLTLGVETDWFLSHYRPEPEMVEATRTVAALAAAGVFVLEGPRAARSLAVLRGLPPAPPDTLVRAIALVLLAAPDIKRSGVAALQEMCDSPEPLLAGVANGTATYLWEQLGDAEAALAAARRMCSVFDSPETRWMRFLSHSRVSELCVQLERGAEAREHLLAVMGEVEAAGDQPDLRDLQWGMVLVNLQIGDVAEAERWVERAGADPDTGTGYGGIRAEILLVKGEVDAGLQLWLQTVERLRNPDGEALGIDALGLEPWTCENQAAAVVAHAQDGRLDLVEDMVRELPRQVHALLADTRAKPLFLADHLPMCGALLLALAMADLDRGSRTGDASITRTGARMIAVAECLRYLRRFQPTMSSTRARRAAEHADRPAYADAVSAYAGLGRDELRAAALALLEERGQG